MNYVSILKKLNKKALKHGDVPVSCIILKDNIIISKAYNMREKKHNPLLHAEIVAIQKAAKKLNTWNLSDCELITTLRPCNMCIEVIRESKIKKVSYILDKNKEVNNNIILCKLLDCDSKYFLEEIRSFFADKR